MAIEKIECDQCEGNGSYEGDRCDNCGGTGEMEVEQDDAPQHIWKLGKPSKTDTWPWGTMRKDHCVICKLERTVSKTRLRGEEDLYIRYHRPHAPSRDQGMVSEPPTPPCWGGKKPE